MTKKNKKTIVRLVTFILTLVVVCMTLKTIAIGIDLALISDSNVTSESWRISDAGSAAANAVYDENTKIRQSIYHSSDAYTRWISTSSKPVQLVVGFGLIGLSGLLLFVWYTYINQIIKRFKKRAIQRKRNISVNRKNSPVY